MVTKTTKYGKGYETPQGLEENQYYELMYEMVDLAKEKGLTVRQAQKLFTDCADMVLDIKTEPNTNTDKPVMSDMDRLIYKLDQIKVRLEAIPSYQRLYYEENIM